MILPHLGVYRLNPARHGPFPAPEADNANNRGAEAPLQIKRRVNNTVVC